MYLESDLLPLSALQHLVFCERQCALIHVEQQWEENRFTAEGRVMHERAHEAERERAGDVLTVRGLRLRSLTLGLSGVADVVEFNERASTVRPVEYKRGKPKSDGCDEAQLCGQAMCLEEMLSVSIAEGDLYYGSQRKRHAVAFTQELRAETRRLALQLHELIDAGITPLAQYDKKCERCSLMDTCMPGVLGADHDVGRYIQRHVREEIK